MSKETVTSSPGRRRSALLASVFALGAAGYVATGAILGDSHIALAEQVRVEAPAPADFSAIVEQVKPAVVSVQVKSEREQVSVQGRGFDDLPKDHPFNEFFRRFGWPGPGDENGGNREFQFRMPQQPPRSFDTSQGSGFFISGDGYVVTNNHVVDGAKEVTVLTDDGRELDAKVIGTDERTDLALLKVEPENGESFKYVGLATDVPKIGQWVVAVGNPFGLGGTVTAGIVSAHNRNIGAGPYDDFIQIDAPVNRGNSGGPTFNTKGEVVGVNTAIFSPSGGNVGIAFAIPATTVHEVVTDLMRDGKVTRGWLGVQIQPVTRDIADSLGITSTDGALVSEPQADSPAKAAGIKAGDVILKVNGTDVKGPRELARTIAAIEPDQTVKLTILRDGKQQDFDVTIGKLERQQAAAEPGAPDETPRAEPASVDALGLALEENANGKGLVVRGVESDSAASENGIETGDVIVSVSGKTVDSVEGVQAEVANAKERGRKAVLMQVQDQDGSTRFVALRLERA